MSNQNIKKIHIDKLIFNSKSHRFSKDFKDENQIINHLFRTTPLVELMWSITNENYFSEELFIVVKYKSFYKVLDGNRRLAAIKLINQNINRNINNNRINKIHKIKEIRTLPCLVIKDYKVKFVLQQLGYRHITGIKSWDMLEKGLYFINLYNDKNSLIENSFRLAKLVGSRQEYVKNMLIAMKIYKHIKENKFYHIENLSNERFNIGFIITALKKTNIQIYFLNKKLIDFEWNDQLNCDNIKDWTHWTLGEEYKLPYDFENKNLDKFNTIVINKKALDAFKKGISLDDAFNLIDNYESEFLELIKRSKRSLEKASQLFQKTNESIISNDELKSIINLCKKIKEVKLEKQLAKAYHDKHCLKC